MQFSTVTQLMALLAVGAIAAPAPLHNPSGQAAALDARGLPGMFARDPQAALDKRQPKKEKVMLKAGSTGYEREYSYGSDSSKSSGSGSQRKPSQPTTKKPAYPLPRPAGDKAGHPLPKPPTKGNKRDLSAEQLDKREPKKEKVMLKSGSTGYEREYSYGSDSSKSSGSGRGQQQQSYPLPKPPAGSKPGKTGKESTSYKLPTPPAGSKPGKTYKKGGKRDLSAEEAAWEDVE